MVVDVSPIEYMVSDISDCKPREYKARNRAPEKSRKASYIRANSIVEKLVDSIDYVGEFMDMKVNQEKKEIASGVQIRRGECPDLLRRLGAAGFLHCHTIYSSDGRLHPEDLVRLSHEKGAKIVAITDHFTRPSNRAEAKRLYRGLKESFKRAKIAARTYGIIFIPGIEYNVEPCTYTGVDTEDIEVAAGHFGVYLPYDANIQKLVKLVFKHKGGTLEDFVDFADKVHKMGGVVVANHVTQQDGIGERCLRHLADKHAVDAVEDVNLGAGLIMPYSIDRSGVIRPYSSRFSLGSIAAQDSHGIPQASVATIFDRKGLEKSVEGLEPDSDEYFAAASREALRQIRDRETAAYFETGGFKFSTSSALEKLRLMHPLIIAKLMTIGITSPDLFNTFFGRAFFRKKPDKKIQNGKGEVRRAQPRL